LLLLLVDEALCWEPLSNHFFFPWCCFHALDVTF
jgi:hypothetical protein